jgi:hypothetical protein
VCLRSGDLQHSIGPSLFHIGLYQNFFYSTFTVRRVLVLKTESTSLVNACVHCDLALFLQCGCSISKGRRSERNPIIHLIIFEVNRMRGPLERMCRYWECAFAVKPSPIDIKKQSVQPLSTPLSQIPTPPPTWN